MLLWQPLLMVAAVGVWCCQPVADRDDVHGTCQARDEAGLNGKRVVASSHTLVMESCIGALRNRKSWAQRAGNRHLALCQLRHAEA